MDRPQMVGLAFGAAASILGTIQLVNTDPLPASARFGALANVDSSNDGRISQAEWVAAGRSVAEMTVLDANGDRTLDPQEAKSRRSAGPRD